MCMCVSTLYTCSVNVDFLGCFLFVFSSVHSISCHVKRSTNPGYICNTLQQNETSNFTLYKLGTTMYSNVYQYCLYHGGLPVRNNVWWWHMFFWNEFDSAPDISRPQLRLYIWLFACMDSKKEGNRNWNNPTAINSVHVTYNNHTTHTCKSHCRCKPNDSNGTIYSIKTV